MPVSPARDFGVQSYCFRNFKDNATLAEKIKAIGVNKTELCGVHADFNKPEAFGDVVAIHEKAGVKIVSLGVQTFAASDASELASLLQHVADRDLVLIDTPGMTVRDARLPSVIDTLKANAPKVRTTLVLPANLLPGSLEHSVQTYAPLAPKGCILTKLDETPSPGAALSIVLRHGFAVEFRSRFNCLQSLHTPGNGAEVILQAEAGFRTAGQVGRVRLGAIQHHEEIEGFLNMPGGDLARLELSPHDVFEQPQSVFGIAGERFCNAANAVFPGEIRKGELGAQSVARIIRMAEIRFEEYRARLSFEPVDAIILAAIERFERQHGSEIR